MNVVLISTYELGRQPFGLASAAAWLKAAGAAVTCFDLAVQRITKGPLACADLVAFYVPMHTATRIAASLVERVKAINPRAHLCFFGLYAPVNEDFLRKLGADTILGGEFEAGLAALVKRLAAEGRSAHQGRQSGPVISLARQQFILPDRSGLPPLDQYAHLTLGSGEQRVVGYTEASRGCKHLCRHCPIVPVYAGTFRVVQREVVLEDIRAQVAAGARHITFGDPDFFNGPRHGMDLVQALHTEFPDVTYDVTIKVEHLLKYAGLLPLLRDTGCAFVTSAVEAVDDHVLEVFDKHHTRADFIRVVSLFRQIGMALNPTFVTFNPWISLAGYRSLLAQLMELDLIDNIASIQLAIRLLIPSGSRLLELREVQQLVGDFDAASLCYSWAHPDPRVDQLCADVLQLVKDGNANGESRRAIFANVWQLAHATSHMEVRRSLETGFAFAQKPIPFLSEPWYC